MSKISDKMTTDDQDRADMAHIFLDASDRYLARTVVSEGWDDWQREFILLEIIRRASL